MQTGRVDEETLRRLAGYESGGPPVLSVYVNLDPSRFALPDARSTEIRSLVDDAHRRIEAGDHLDHEQRAAGLDAVRRVRDWLEGPSFDASGAHGLAVFSAGDDLFEALRLPRPVESEVMIGTRPFVEPLVDMASSGGWCVLLTSRQSARIFRGSVDHLDEVASIGERPPRGQHDQGGWSQARYERAVGEGVDDHLKHSAEVVHRRFKRAPFQHLLVGATSELAPRMEDRLHPSLRALVAGRIDLDVENARPDDVLAAARPLMEAEDRRAEQQALERLRERMADGRGASGLEDVLEALAEQRVETLLLADGFSATGGVCPRCGWLGPERLDTCPADGNAMERREDIGEVAIGRALAQSATVRIARHFGEELRGLGGIAAVLRF